MKHFPGKPLSAPELGRLGNLLLALHQAANDLSALNAFLQSATEAFAASAAFISIVEPGDSQWRFVDVYPRRPEHLSAYEAEYAEGDPVRLALAKVPAATPMLLSDLLSPEQRLADRFYEDTLLRRWGCRDVLAVRLVIEDNFGCYFGLVRTDDQPAFDVRDRDFLALIVPHLQRGLELQALLDRLGIFSQISLEQMLQSGQGLVVLGEDGAPVYMSRVAARLVGDARLFNQPGGRLQLGVDHLRDNFRELVDTCITLSRNGDVRSVGRLSVPREGTAPLEISVVPLKPAHRHENLLGRGGRAVVTMQEGGRQRHDVRRQLMQIYGLSDAEAEVCWRVSNGDSVGHIATDTGATRETVRSQLKRVFAKTGVRRQPDLVRLVLLGPAAWLRIP